MINANEFNLITKLGIENVAEITRKSDREYDILIEYFNEIGLASAWLPLLTIRQSNWTKFAPLSDYPEMVAHGDWSGIRDTNVDTIWTMFDIQLKEISSH